MAQLGMKTVLAADFDDAITRVTEALKSEGFGVLTEIDVKSTLNQKLGVDFRRYKILGACNPPFAHQVLELDLDAGLLLPCNVVVYEKDGGGSVVTIVDPIESVWRANDPKLSELAGSVKEKLARVLAKLG